MTLTKAFHNEPLSRHSSFRIGGTAKYFFLPKTIDDFIEACLFSEENALGIIVIGLGTNVLFPDEGISDNVIISTKGMDEVHVLNGGRIKAGAGARLSKVADIAQKEGLGGLAFAAGIPGTIGGAIAMNAGAYGSEIGKHVESVTLLDFVMPEEKKFRPVFSEIPGNKMNFGYRTSKASEQQLYVTDVTLILESQDTTKIKEEMRQLNKRRQASQPLEYPSAGSFFKRPNGGFAGKLIEDAGLKGFSVGGAQVSEKHAGFIINKNNATAKDVTELMKLIQKKVLERSGILLEPEVKLFGGHSYADSHCYRHVRCGENHRS